MHLILCLCGGEMGAIWAESLLTWWNSGFVVCLKDSFRNRLFYSWQRTFCSFLWVKKVSKNKVNSSMRAVRCVSLPSSQQILIQKVEKNPPKKLNKNQLDTGIKLDIFSEKLWKYFIEWAEIWCIMSKINKKKTKKNKENYYIFMLNTKFTSWYIIWSIKVL